MSERALQIVGLPGVRDCAAKRFLRDPAAERTEVVRDWRLRSDQQKVARLGLPGLDVWENSAECGVENSYRAKIDIVSLQPLGEHAARVQFGRDGFVEFARKETGNSGPIRIRWLGHDAVIFVATGEEQFARVAGDQVQLRIWQAV